MKTDDDSTIKRKWGQREKEIREYLGKSQEEVAEDAGIRQATVSKLESGEGTSNGVTLYKIIDRSFGIAEEEFYQYGKPPSELTYKKKK